MVLMTWHLKGEGSALKSFNSSWLMVLTTFRLLLRLQNTFSLEVLKGQLTLSACFIPVKFERSLAISGTLQWAALDTLLRRLHRVDSGSQKNKAVISFLNLVVTISCKFADVMLYLGFAIFIVRFLSESCCLRNLTAFPSACGSSVLLEVSPS